MSASALWTVDEMAAAMGAERRGPLPPTVEGLSIDSRTVGPGEAFFAIADRRDGHRICCVRAAAQAGLAVVAANPPVKLPPDAPLLVVPDVLAGLRALAAAARRAHTPKSSA